MTITQKRFNILAWKLFALALILPLLVFLQSPAWRLTHITGYTIFPFLGLIAWLTMATHFMLAALRIKLPSLKRTRYFKQVTGYTVLACILLHPGIIIYKQWQKGWGLPPGSIYGYVGEAGKTAIMLGLISLIIFLSFELFDRLRDKAWVIRNWRWIDLSQMVAMTFIFVHALRLGDDVQQGQGWFRAVWFGVGLILIPCFYIIMRHDFKGKTNV